MNTTQSFTNNAVADSGTTSKTEQEPTSLQAEQAEKQKFFEVHSKEQSLATEALQTQHRYSADDAVDDREEVEQDAHHPLQAPVGRVVDPGVAAGRDHIAVPERGSISTGGLQNGTSGEGLVMYCWNFSHSQSLLLVAVV
ncbi:hypothetical protein Aduo_012846 [Ancylostoma duodenale]